LTQSREERVHSSCHPNSRQCFSQLNFVNPLNGYHEELEIAYQTIEQERERLKVSNDELEQRVTERTAELQQREEFLSSIYDGAEQAIFVVDLNAANDLYYSGYNRLAEQFSELSCEYVCGKTPEEVFGEEIGTRFRQNYERCLAAGSSTVYEEHLVFGERHLWTLTTLSPIRNEQGAIYRIVGTCVNITERKQLELALQSSEERYRLMFENNPNPMWFYDPETLAFLEVNQAAIAHYGYSKEEFLQMTIADIRPFADRCLVHQVNNQLLLGESHIGIWQHYKKDGSIIDVEATAYTFPVKGKQANLVIIKDITDRMQFEAERHQARVAIQKSEEQLRLALELTHVGGWDWNLLTRTVSWTTENQYYLFGYQPGTIDVDYQKWRDRVHPDDIHWVEQTVNAALIEQRDISVEYRVLLPDHSIRWILTKARGIYSEAGQAIRVVGFNFDTSDRKEAEFALQQQIERELLITDIAQDIRRSLNLNNVLSRTVQRVREFLKTDRTLIFRFRPDWQGDVIMESVGDDCQSILSTTIFDPCFRDHCIEPYTQGKISALEDINQAEVAPCYVELLQQFQVKANLVVPILQGDKLWGLLIAHQCSSPRQWQTSEIDLLRQLATQVGIAIQQSELYEQTRRELLAREQMQTVLEESEERFRTLSAAAPVGILQANADGICLYSNTQWQEISGQSFVDSLGNGWLQAVHPDDWQRVHHAWETYVQSESGSVPEFRILTPAGNIRWVFMRVSAIRSTSGETVGFVSTFADITERKDSEIQLRKMSTALSHSVEGISQLDEQGHYLSVNEAYAHMIGYTPDEMLGMDWHQTVHPHDLEEVIAAYHRMLQHGKVEVEARGVRKDGSVFYKELSMVAAYNDQHELTGHYCFMKDISEKKRLEAERRQAEQALRESEQRLQAILDHSPAVIYLVDTQNRHLLVNYSYSGLFSMSPSEIVGKSIYEFWPVEVADVFASQNRTVLETGQLMQLEEVVPYPSGARTYLTVKSLLCDAIGNPYAVCGVSTDITEKKQLEAQFYRAQRLESLGTLASGIAHDLNNVLTPIVAISQLLHLKQPSLDQRSHDMLKVIEDSAKRGANMIKQILTFARGTSGECQPVAVVALIQEVITVIQQTFPKSIKIYQDIPHGTSWSVSADSTYLHQVFMNLCVNARDAMPNGGTLSLSIDSCFIDQAFTQTNLDARVGHYVVITITDTGTGIPSNVRDHIFDPFFTTKEIGQGTGLGLATALGIVRNYGGFLQVASEVGQGTEMKVYLPLIAGMQTQSQRSQASEGNGELVLVVDDDPAVQCSTQVLLENHHYAVLVANDGIEAIALYIERQADIQLIILDMMMPSMDGAVLIARLKQINPKIKIIAMSGLPTNREAALTAGADTFLSKPYTLNYLLQNVYTLITA